MVYKIKCRHCDGITSIKIGAVERLTEENKILRNKVYELEYMLGLSGKDHGSSSGVKNPFEDIFGMFK